MRKLIESTFVTLDGVVEQPQDWTFPYWEDDEHQAYADLLLEGADALLLGRETYEVFAEAWPTREGPFAERINAMRTYVASRTLREATWNATVLGEDVAAEVAALKQQPGAGILKYGTGELDLTLLEHGLIDELHFWVFPVIAGRGGRLLEGFDLTHLRLLDTKVLSSEVVVHVCAPK